LLGKEEQSDHAFPSFEMRTSEPEHQATDARAEEEPLCREYRFYCLEKALIIQLGTSKFIYVKE
jgi:hypothetical protein